MKDDELEIWRRQWNSQPSVPIDLIRKVERQTVYMKFENASLILPGLIGVATIIAAVRMPTAPWILLSIGVWCFNIIGGYIQIRNSKGAWAPVADTTEAYVEVSIRRCRAKLGNMRLFFVMAPLLTAFVMIVVYQIIASAGELRTPKDFLIMIGSFAYAGGIVAFVSWLTAGKRKKVQAEMAYLLNLQQQLQTEK